MAVLFVMQLQTHAQPPVSCTIQISEDTTYQTIDNIGSSGAWFSEFIGRYWHPEIRNQLAEWLFSKGFDKNGQPKGIGLSSFRFNIGGGTTELGDSSRIKDFRRRVECFLNADGTYDWNKQSGYLWFVREAKKYGVEKLIAFSNTPPVSMTKNGLGYKTVKDYHSNLRDDKYTAYADFLQQVLQHFDKEKIHFDYISPVNEPQWDWYNNNQEGSPWSNEEIAHVVKTLNNSLQEHGNSTQIILPEAGHLEYLYADKGGTASHQLQTLYNPQSSNRINNLPHVLNIIGGHSYFTDGNDSFRIAVRKNLSDSATKYHTQYWETEYSMLGDNYKEGKKGRIPSIDCALFLAKVIHDDLVYGNAAAWQFWNSWEPGNADFDTRYNLIALHPADATFHDGEATATKNLWVLGQYSRFVRPGMRRIDAKILDNKSDIANAQDIMVAAFSNKNQTSIVLINYTEEEKNIRLTGLRKKEYKEKFNYFVTDKTHDMSPFTGKDFNEQLMLFPRSITTIILKK
ncbi:beta-glycosidase [Arachidicoccus ginsenosidimutans]|uniref:glycoside hydrolase n=1 Tax=Arachidicoccus sp. BS20 TaxID=1850526 RepID=UPI0007F0A9F2|nr:glycoside hydrolase [Arachidicoccus sp. BS20]ANI89082.1 beta-glycosidase [Arachidicoccus sp. BS20]